MTNQTIETIPTMGDEELWNRYRDLYEDTKISKEDYFDVKWGLNYIPFDFVFYLTFNDREDKTDEWIRDLPTSGRVKVGKIRYHIHDYLEEIDRRRSKMRRLIKQELEIEENASKARY